MISARVGIVGAGQLGRMMGLAAYPLGIECRFVDTAADSPGGQVGPIRVAALDDADAIEAMAREVDVVTFDIENVSADLLDRLLTHAPVRPAPPIVAAAQDRLTEKTMFGSLEIPTGPYSAVDSAAMLADVADAIGFPIVLKARRLGYDGRGQRIADDLEGLRRAWSELGEVPAIAEAFVRFDREVSLVGVRGIDGTIASYPLTENVHRDGILRTSVAPYSDAALHAAAHEALTRIMNHYEYVGVLTIEFFATPDGLLANEVAPRVHNSGHWTIEGAETSQFENHIRAITGLPLGSTAARGHAGMLNLLGEIPDRARLLAVPGLHLHDYGKSPRPDRKLGHCTLTDTDRDRLLERMNAVAAMLGEPPVAA